jgi:hypothetical protein
VVDGQPFIAEVVKFVSLPREGGRRWWKSPGGLRLLESSRTGMNQHQNELIRSDLIQPLIVIYVEESTMINPFKKDKEITAKEKKKKKKQEERRKRAQARGEKPIK